MFYDVQRCLVDCANYYCHLAFGTNAQLRREKNDQIYNTGKNLPKFQEQRKRNQNDKRIQIKTIRKVALFNYLLLVFAKFKVEYKPNDVVFISSMIR